MTEMTPAEELAIVEAASNGQASYDRYLLLFPPSRVGKMQQEVTLLRQIVESCRNSGVSMKVVRLLARLDELRAGKG